MWRRRRCVSAAGCARAREPSPLALRESEGGGGCLLVGLARLESGRMWRPDWAEPGRRRDGRQRRHRFWFSGFGGGWG